MAGNASSCTVAERIRELGGLWHLWKAHVMEDMGELPAGLEEQVGARIAKVVEDTRAKLEDALRACDETASSLKNSSKCARDARAV